MTATSALEAWPTGVRYFVSIRGGDDALWITMVDELDAYWVPQYAVIESPMYTDLPLCEGVLCGGVQHASATQRAALPRRAQRPLILVFADAESDNVYFISGDSVRFPATPPTWLE